jgi:pimeloyl-ACP methyl ester carboxylesterase
MKTAKIDGVELEYEIKGTGEPLLLIATGPIADSFHPFLSERALLDRYRMVAYHQRGQAGSGRPPGSPPVSFEQHAADAAALLRHLDLPRAHVAGHSTGGDIALQLALAEPRLVHTLVLLEPLLPSAPSAPATFEEVAPALAASGAGDHQGAMETFMSVVSGLAPETWRALIKKHVPGGVPQVLKDAQNFFTSYIPALTAWQFGPTQAATIGQPMLSVLGGDTKPLFVDGDTLLRGWFPQIQRCTVENIGHLLHLQRPEEVMSAVGAWLAQHPMRAV